MTLWDWLQPILGMDVRFPVTVVFLMMSFAWSLVLSSSFVMSAMIVLIDAFFMRWFPGITMAGTFMGLGLVTIVLAVIDHHIGLLVPNMAEKPEYLPDGALVGYKWVTRHTEQFGSAVIAQWQSPVQGSCWKGNELTADHLPGRFNLSGIYVYYSKETARRARYNEPGNFLVQVACDRKIVYHEVGARVEHVEILQVLQMGD